MRSVRSQAAECVTAQVTYHGEGPYWDARTGRLLFVDVLAGDVMALESSGETTRYETPFSVATVIRRRARGGYVLAVEREIVTADEDLSNYKSIAVIAADGLLRTNDGGCDTSGAFYVGTMAYDGAPNRGSLYRVTEDHLVSEVVPSVSISNGLQWSRNGKQAFYIDSPTRRIDSFDVDAETGQWSNRTGFVTLKDEVGVPDGMAIDEDDGLWVALWGGGAVHHYDAEGVLVEKVTVPGVTQVSSCTFGGEERKILYITTSRQGLCADQQPNAGALFAVETSSRGAPLAQFSG